ncbi:MULTISPECIES: hypothetical protein [unclassified Aeromicrobium]|uniref:hypothetical protein n=1 Tax=unclassified Aeromicrobium TaxID=2633570 RepID=UPI00288BE8F4|nr:MULTISPECIES: hypothetical protein [unclassified Aeromicrobium]
MSTLDLDGITWTLAICGECSEPLSLVNGLPASPWTLHVNEKRQHLIRPHDRTCAALLATVIAQKLGRAHRGDDVVAARAVVEFIRDTLLARGQESAALHIDAHADAEAERTGWDGSPGLLGNWVNGIRDGARLLRGEVPRAPEEAQ